jgi:dipeptidyl aminopeptidase/acylaminoacyl peptidase
MRITAYITIIILILVGFVGFLNFSNVNELYRNTVNFAEKSIIREGTDENIVEDSGKISSPISINYLRQKQIDSEIYKVESRLLDGFNYEQYIVSYLSEGERVFGLLTIPKSDKPEGGFPAIIFNHGYIPPKSYSTTSNYSSYVDFLARNGFVVFKIDMRGHGRSEGLATGSYFSSTYTIDAISALKSLQKSDVVNPNRIGFWGHSMSGNLVLRSMLITEEIKAGVIWAGAVYSYEDFGKYRISDSSFMARPQQPQIEHPNRDTNEEIRKLREDFKSVDFSNSYWKEISLTQNIKYLKNPLQIHHSVNDDVVNVGYSRDLVNVLKNSNKNYDYHEYPGGGHNITGYYFNQGMQRTVEFFKKNL